MTIPEIRPICDDCKFYGSGKKRDGRVICARTGRSAMWERALAIQPITDGRFHWIDDSNKHTNCGPTARYKVIK